MANLFMQSRKDSSKLPATLSDRLDRALRAPTLAQTLEQKQQEVFDTLMMLLKNK